MARLRTFENELSAFVEVLTADKTGESFGYHYFGARRGPLLFVSGWGETAAAVYDDLIAIPSLQWVRGQLILVRSDVASQYDEDLLVLSLKEPVDHFLALPHVEKSSFSVRRQYMDVLHQCAELGMIAGRGVFGTT